MSILTKVFIVLLVVFSIAFASMAVSTVAQTANWKDTAQKYEEHARVADTNLRHEIAASAALLATARDDSRMRLERIGKLEGELQGARNQVAGLSSETARAESEKSSAEAMSRGLFAQLQATEAGRVEYRKQRDELEGIQIDLQQRNVDLSDRVNELTAQVTVLVEQKRQYEQQVSILRAENEHLSQQARRVSRGATIEDPAGAAMVGVTPLTPIPSRAIRGEVLEVTGNLVTLSVGSADGVKKDMIFVIHRDGEYVGDIRVNVIDPNQSAGRIVRSSSIPTVGDEITDALALSGSRG